ncbi:hypothetical protein V6B33_05675 [Mangrovibacillus sp. Mu-81]|uniref:hypothetical protein n=1 Tax=Mangrovibacillus sp. Mu-81 TaxID=3121478 RepID=UPI002FE456B2
MNQSVLYNPELIQGSIFYHTEDLRIYLWVLFHAREEAGYEGGFYLEKGQYIQSISELKDRLWFYNGKKKDEYSKSRIQRSIKRLERCGWIRAEKMQYGYVFTVFELTDGKERSGGTGPLSRK